MLKVISRSTFDLQLVLKTLVSSAVNYAMQTSLLSSNVTTSCTDLRLTMVFPLSLSDTLETIQFQWEEERLPDVRPWSEKPFTCRMFFSIQNSLVPAINLRSVSDLSWRSPIAKRRGHRRVFF